ncbi:ATP synthase subunit I [Alkalicoccobacillus gibsonii]|uniref:ATP synthase subunit I n=1 Tax=Alkalicoccobacillus gibsonii TaxID=79881 RepID=UPI001931C302|nr:ATP synthase subunit I [Alkalicoccobacillus gibsonii]MBM0065849.1 ATP synthase subunit I [Alkalicoccobacillus gibsonii]
MVDAMETNMKRYATILGVCAAICMIGLIVSSYRILFLSFLIGQIAGTMNLLLNYLDAKIVGHVAIKQNKKLSMVVGISFVARILCPVIIIYTAMIFPEWLRVLYVLAGFSSVYVMLLLDSLFKVILKER